MFGKSEFRLLWSFYVSALFSSVFAVLGVYQVVYLLGIGLSYFQLSVLLGLFGLSMMLFDIPTGVVADLFGRKLSVVLSYISKAFILLLIPFSNDFAYLVLLFVLWGLAETLYTGAYEAWVVDNLHREKRKELIDNCLEKRLFCLSIPWQAETHRGLYVLSAPVQ